LSSPKAKTQGNLTQPTSFTTTPRWACKKSESTFMNGSG
jgi:hypothetical protein